jgi:hypothetical protein
VELAFLCQAYNLDKSICEFTEFNDPIRKKNSTGETKDPEKKENSTGETKDPEKKKNSTGETEDTKKIPKFTAKKYKVALCTEEKLIASKSDYYYDKDDQGMEIDRESSSSSDSRKRTLKSLQSLLSFEKKTDLQDQDEVREEVKREMVAQPVLRRKSRKSSGNFEGLRRSILNTTDLISPTLELAEKETPSLEDSLTLMSEVSASKTVGVEPGVTVDGEKVRDEAKFTYADQEVASMEMEYNNFLSEPSEPFISDSQNAEDPQLESSARNGLDDLELTFSPDPPRVPPVEIQSTRQTSTSPHIDLSQSKFTTNCNSKPAASETIDLTFLDSDEEKEIIQQSSQNSHNAKRSRQIHHSDNEFDDDEFEFIGVVQKATNSQQENYNGDLYFLPDDSFDSGKKKRLQKKLKKSDGSPGFTMDQFLSKETIVARNVEKERRQTLSTFNYFEENDKAIALNNLRPEGEPAVNVPSSFIANLKPHQVNRSGLFFSSFIYSSFPD